MSLSGDDRSTSHVLVLDAVRGAVCLLVLACHADSLGGGIPSRLDDHAAGFTLNLMAATVHLFFALSGFLVAGPFVRALVSGAPLPSMSRYAVRRSARILPAYWIALTATIIVIKGNGVRLWQIPVHYLLLQELVPGESEAILFLAWTLGLEMIFYILLPFVATGIRRLSPGPIPVKRFALTLLGVWVAVAIVTPPLDHIAAGESIRSPLGVVTGVSEGLAMFVPGILVYLAQLQFRSGEKPWLINRLASDQPVTVLATAVVLYLVGRVVWAQPASDIALRALVIWAVACGLILLVLVRHPTSGPITRLLGWVGTVSYGLYLWHGVIVTAAAHHPRFVPLGHSGPVPYVVHLAIVLGLSLVLAYFSWRWIEEPMINRSHKFRPSQPAPAPVLQPATDRPGD